jgi:hypothetical protein
MAEWGHKEREWSKNEYSVLNGDSMQNRDNGRFSRSRSFTEWLDWQCEGGWEVFKISRNFNAGSGRDTWCIFRKME